MSIKKRLLVKLFSAALAILGVAVFAMGQAHQPATQHLDQAATIKSNARQATSQTPVAHREDNKRSPDSTKYSYEFTQPQFTLSHIVIEHDVAGRGKITFERLGETTPIVEPVELSTAALARILGLWNILHFLDSAESYQSDKQFPHLGTTKVQMDDGQRKRTAEFNWTRNKQAFALVNEYRRVADQAVLVFDIAIARENQPLNAPKLMEQFEILLTRNGLSDAYQLVPLLRDMTRDEHLPLIARNHATRLLKRIEK